MAHLQESSLTLRIHGDDLVPEEMTALLGVTPTYAVFKGEKIIGRKTGIVRFAKSGMWSFSASDRKPADMDGQIQEILNQLTADLTVWQNITSRFEIDLFCGLRLLHSSNEVETLNPESLSSLGVRGIKMILDIFYLGDEDQPQAFIPKKPQPPAEA